MKNYFISLFLLVFCTLLHANAVNNPPELVINLMNYCYETKNQFGIDLAKCILNKLDKIDNPFGYRVALYDAQPQYAKNKSRPFSLTIYNKFGDVLLCQGIAQEKIIFNKCEHSKVPDLTPAKELSINPDEP